ncbi:leucyl aminopeptidase family protein [Asticcacaulis sp. BYS171W]|uniref:Leucyl aminopeptidase family protein n=1 Tax=Asticcacaulis aquaticus TaxID=2984212 RepID=A0ABT5HY18_9CAUL|nr:leucyl aminopeptidase family protein [Asticcacaulis aquaticus]MDC7684976.1 leucyl aminopeptidase family protein [Asticcacaulis aquaticus]
MPKPLPNTGVKRTEHIVFGVFEDEAEGVIAALKPAHAGFLTARGFTGKAGSIIVLPSGLGSNETGALWVWFGLGARKAYNPLIFRALPSQLPTGEWRLKVDEALDRKAIHVAFQLGSYAFDRYKSGKNLRAEVTLESADLSEETRTEIAREVAAHDLVRDLVNTPANDMGPAEIEAAARGIADRFGAKLTVITGDELLTENFPAVHAVGRGAVEARGPRFIEIDWTPHVEDISAEPKPVIALVGKGVAFDTGGLNIKGGAGMALMKKDMGGAAHALALAQWIMESNLRVRLHVLISAVENAISGDAFRPGDVIASRAGKSIDIGNTDAEGRLILADALTRAGELTPDLTLDFATLTGAARVALGPEVIPFYTDDEEIARRLEVASIAEHDPLWRMPLWAGYRDALDSDIADLRNDPQGWAQAGSVTAALFLQKFAPETGAWVHFDVYAWNPRGRPGFPVGAEAQTLRACFNLIKGL